MSKAKFYDIAAASPIMIFYAFAVGGLIIQIHADIHRLAFSGELALSVCTKATAAAFLGLQIVLFGIRKLPIAKSKGWRPRAMALIGSYAAISLLLLPPIQAPAYLAALSSFFTVAGTILSIYILGYLGKSFSVTPQARALVTAGPYHLIRHPLYLVEQIATFGIMLQYRQPWGLFLFVFSAACQWPRMHYEEAVLAEAFPSYIGYSKRTARLIPGVY